MSTKIYSEDINLTECLKRYFESRRLEVNFVEEKNADFNFLMSKDRTLNKSIYLTYEINDILDNPEERYILLPIGEKIEKIFDSIFEKTYIFAELPQRGTRKIFVNEINYINLEQRCLQFHLKDETVSSKCLRNSFADATVEVRRHTNMLFIEPSLIINLDNVKELYHEYLVFKNEEVLYFPRRHEDKIKEAWRA